MEDKIVCCPCVTENSRLRCDVIYTAALLPAAL